MTFRSERGKAVSSVAWRRGLALAAGITLARSVAIPHVQQSGLSPTEPSRDPAHAARTTAGAWRASEVHDPAPHRGQRYGCWLYEPA